MKTTCAILLIFTLSTVGFAQSFRGVSWGATPKQVAQSEKSKPSFVSGASLVYDSVVVHGFPLRVSYDFKGGRLTGADYRATAPVSDSAQIKKAFVDLAQDAVLEMGEPTVLADNAATRLTFQSKTNTATILFGRTADGNYSLNAFYRRPVSPTPAKPKTKPRPSPNKPTPYGKLI